MSMNATLRELADRRGLLIGAACSPDPVANEPLYRETLAREFNCLVAENCMKPLYCWDVVNEALGDAVGWRVKSPWFEAIGPDYVDHAFRFAHEADPTVQLFYNDYGMDQPGPKADACYRMIQRMLSAGLPVHGVGFQYHLGAGVHQTRVRRAAPLRPRLPTQARLRGGPRGTDEFV
jgi:GH35 family endo-1,4-beta-xylanase